MMHHARDHLAEIGFRAYEISNYATPGEQCRHNLLYWSGDNYIGLGPSAASHVQGTRFKNAPHLGEWENAISSDALAAAEVETLSPRQRADELLMLRLRLAEGLNLAEFYARTSFDASVLYAKPIARLTALGLLVADNNHLCLSDIGLNVADSVASELISQPNEVAQHR